jgi:hypothetical protein
MLRHVNSKRLHHNPFCNLATEPEGFRQRRPLFGIVRRDVRVILFEAECLTILLRRQIMFRAQMASQRLELFAAAQACDGIRRDVHSSFGQAFPVRDCRRRAAGEEPESPSFAARLYIELLRRWHAGRDRGTLSDLFV